MLVCIATKIEVKLHRVTNTCDKLSFIEEELFLTEIRMLKKELKLYIIKIWTKVSWMVWSQQPGYWAQM